MMSVNIKQNLVSSSKYKIKCPNAMKPEYITVHNTANDASAANEIKYMLSNNNQTSYHFAVDDKEAIQGIPLDRNAWHCGDGGNGNGNRKSIGVEICYSKSGGERYKAAEANAVKLIAMLLKERGWGIDRVKQHYDWSKKNCPHRIREECRWDEFIAAIQKEMSPPKTIHFYTGGYVSGSLLNIHDFLRNKKWWFKPERHENGTMFFLIGGFAEGSAAAKEMEQFLKDNNYWYQIQ